MPSPGDALVGLLRQADSLAQSAGVIASDWKSTLLRKEQLDWFERRDPEYIRRTLPTFHAYSSYYHRGEVRGLENIPDEGPVLLVGNHSGGTLIADTFVFSAAFYDHFGPTRDFHQLAHDMVFRIPGLRALLPPWGTVPANPENMQRALELGAALLVYPGGDWETYRPSWESAKIAFAGRKGFARLALEHDVPIVPVVSIGGQETALFLGQGRRLSSVLQLNRLFRIKVFPPVLGPPVGGTILDLPIRFPLPAKITISVGQPINLREKLGADAEPEEAYKLVTTNMQRTLTRLGHERTIPVVG
ncbi:MAG TPA: lysophospholipid acyltransferase family protein [Thermoleophilaceae bacterium]|jgi:1-acyl-sn-glycerol-3-phosphate acyltransferase|nr:lysophospholipid acyltransferase family protein [Thermoleophilaceae bacterium]